jgi:hypothetical protein
MSVKNNASKHLRYRGIIKHRTRIYTKNQRCHSKMISSCGKGGFYGNYRPDHTGIFFNRNRS